MLGLILMSEQSLSPEFADNLYDNVFKLWANPEIERRRSAGMVSEGYKPWAVQVLMDPAAPTQVRFDHEVNGVFRLAPDSDASDDELISPLNFHEIADSVVAFELGEDDSPNAGHITLLRHREGFYITFDLNYNTERIADHVQVAREYLDVAKLSFDKGLLRGFTSNLYHAVELLAKSSLFRLGHKGLIKSKTHSLVRSQYNLHSRSGITDPRYASLLNKLVEMRNDARYLDRPFSLDVTEAEEMLATAEEMYNTVLSQAHPRTQRLVQEGNA